MLGTKVKVQRVKLLKNEVDNTIFEWICLIAKPSNLTTYVRLSAVEDLVDSKKLKSQPN